MSYTVRITETTDSYYIETAARGLELIEQTVAYIYEGDEPRYMFGGPVSEEWLPTEWDAALGLAGYQRIGEWNVSEGTASVKRTSDLIEGR